MYRGQLPKRSAEAAMRQGHMNIGFYGRGTGMPETDALRFMRKMVVEGYISERLYNNRYDGTVAYAELTPKGKEVATGKSVPKVRPMKFTR